MMVYIVAFISIALGAVAQLWLKIGAETINQAAGVKSMVTGMLQNVYFWSGLASYGLSLVLWLYVLANLELSKAYPLVSLGYVLAAILGFLFLNEQLNATRIAGLIFIVIGVCLIARS